MTTEQQDWPTYTGFDGQQYPLPSQTCPKCGKQYPAMFARKLGCHECVEAYRARGGYTAKDWSDAIRRNMMAEGVDPDACDCGQCAECEERADARS